VTGIDIYRYICSDRFGRCYSQESSKSTTQQPRTTALIRYERQDARHSDLNFSNVAVEETSEGHLKAWVFDVAGGGAGANVRDLATLEITALLHQSPGEAGAVIDQC
jgi:hypothetical protein